MSKQKLFQIAAFVGFFALLSILMIEIEAFELFYDFTRDHEDWDLDEYVGVALSALITGVVWFGIDAHQKSQEIARISSENIKKERMMSDARRVQALGTLAGGVAHSGNNLMQPVLTLARLSKGQLDESHAVQGHLDRIIVAATNASGLFNSILKFSREESELSASTDIVASINENQELFAAAVPKTISLDFDIAETSIDVPISSNNLLDIVLALLSNGVDAYEGRPGTINVSIQRSDEAPDHIDLSIRDHGKGIDLNLLARVFEPFYTNKDVGQGTGLGLAIVKSLVEDAGGKISISSKPNVGTTVIVSLPCKITQTDE